MVRDRANIDNLQNFKISLDILYPNRFLWTKLHINRNEKPYIVGLSGHISMVVVVPIGVGSA